MLFGTKKVIGLDIGTSNIKIAEMEVSRRGVILNSFAVSPTPPGAVNGGEISNIPGVAATVQALLAQSKMKRRNACTGMWGTAVIVKKISIPRIDKKMVAEQIKWEAEQYIPFDINEISLAHHIINPNGHSETMDILLIAAQNELVNQYLNVMTSAGLSGSIIDVSGFALANIFEVNYGKIPNQAVALLNIGSSVTNFVVVIDGEVIFTRDIPVGGFNYTNEISKEMGISFAEAESLKLGACAGHEVPEEVHNIIKNTNQSVSDEIRNSFDFFIASNSGVNISRIYFTGGSSAVPGLIELLSHEVSLPAEGINPFMRVVANPKIFNSHYLKQIAPFVSVVMGLGLRQVGDS
jgi:type IV pilus assembly protein PilM